MSLSLSSCVSNEKKYKHIHYDKIELKITLAKNTSGSNFSCGSSGLAAEYIPLWPALSWITELMVSRDKPCAKLVRSKNCHDQGIGN